MKTTIKPVTYYAITVRYRDHDGPRRVTRQCRTATSAINFYLEFKYYELVRKLSGTSAGNDDALERILDRLERRITPIFRKIFNEN